jgi:hypothetical protein
MDKALQHPQPTHKICNKHSQIANNSVHAKRLQRSQPTLRNRANNSQVAKNTVHEKRLRRSKPTPPELRQALLDQNTPHS